MSLLKRRRKIIVTILSRGSRIIFCNLLITMFGLVKLPINSKIILLRLVERNDKIHKIQVINSKLRCDCQEDLFSGCPCRHLAAIFVKSSAVVAFDKLPFNDRWRKLYHVENLTDPEYLSPVNNVNEENKVRLIGIGFLLL